jgi:ribosomal protein L9
VAEDPQDQALRAALQEHFATNFLILVGLMASANPAMLKLYNGRMEALKKRAELGGEYMKTLDESQKLKWWLAHLEQLNEDVGVLIREIRAKYNG